MILAPLQLRTHHIGQAPGPAGASPHLPKLPAGAAEASGRAVVVGLRPLLTQSRRAIVSFGMTSEALGNKRRARTPDVPNAPDPRSENTSAADEYLGMVEQDVQEDCCGEEES